MRQFAFLILSLFALTFTSCSTLKKTAQNMKLPKLKKPNLSLKLPKLKKPNLAFLNPKNFSWKDLRGGKKVPLVTVDDSKTIKDQKPAQPLYLAYSKKKKKYGITNKKGTSFKPVDLDPAKLPGGESAPVNTYGLLPTLGLEESAATLPAPPPSTGKLEDLPDVGLPDIPEDLLTDLDDPTLPSPEVIDSPKPAKKAGASPAPAFLEFNPPE